MKQTSILPTLLLASSVHLVSINLDEISFCNPQCALGATMMLNGTNNESDYDDGDENTRWGS